MEKSLHRRVRVGNAIIGNEIRVMKEASCGGSIEQQKPSWHQPSWCGLATHFRLAWTASPLSAGQFSDTFWLSTTTIAFGSLPVDGTQHVSALAPHGVLWVSPTEVATHLAQAKALMKALPTVPFCLSHHTGNRQDILYWSTSEARLHSELLLCV